VSDTVTLVADAEGPEVLGANLAVGSRLVASGVAFLFMAFVFAFFYLRALNTSHSFRGLQGGPPTNPPVGWGIAVLACVLASVAVFELVRRGVGHGTEINWRLGSLAAWLLGLAAVVLQVVEYLNLHFGATSGGLASVFFGFTAVFGVFWLGGVYWIETLWAQSMRRPEAAESGVGTPAALLRPSADACVIYLYVMSVIALFAFVLLYLVK
jgi:heme/copper-type cytochrome/quinol oxidase subunit 3